VYARNAGLCLEAQHAPDAPNHKNFASTQLLAGEHYRQRVEYRLRTRAASRV